MISSVGTTRSEALRQLGERKEEILQKAENGEIQPAIAIGGNAFTDGAWNKLIERVDANVEVVKEEQEERFARIDKEQAEKAALKKLEEQKSEVPYSYLAKDGMIEYNGVIFVCDEEHRAICLGDMTKAENVITIPLAEGGCLKVNRNNLSELSQAISMFSPADIRRILVAIQQDAKCEQMKLQLDEDSESIGDAPAAEPEHDSADEITAEQVALLLQDREKCDFFP